MTQVVGQGADEFATRKVELVLQQLESLPTLPALAVRLLNLTGSSTSKTKEVVELISMDVALTAKVLSLVGSAASGVRQPITSVHQAVPAAAVGSRGLCLRLAARPGQGGV